MKVLLEVCVDSLESAIIAAENGADRLELCANLPVGGGTTPSIGFVKSVTQLVDLPIMVLIRCRPGPFQYTDAEVSVMVRDIRQLVDVIGAGRFGMVIGALTSSGTVDSAAVGLLLQAAGPTIPATFSRAFDMVRDANEALEAVLAFPTITRILTSGLAPTCITGLDVIRQLITSERLGTLRILPGSGIKSSNVLHILTTLYPLWTNVNNRLRSPRYVTGELHLSAGAFSPPTESAFRRESLGFGLGATCGQDSTEWERREWGKWTVQAEELREVRRLVDDYVDSIMRTRASS